MTLAGDSVPKGGPDAVANDRECDYLSFGLGSDEYGIDIRKVQEIRSGDPLTPIVNAQACIKGVINLRGVCIPIVDLRAGNGFGKSEGAQFEAVIILSLPQRVVGIAVDGVTDVVTLSAGHIQRADDSRNALHARFATRVGACAGRRLLLLDIEQLMHSAEFKVPGPLPQ
jgi:purine-binding chemotaxis protein CheW